MIVNHKPKWELALLPVDQFGNTATGYTCVHELENGQGQCEASVFNLNEVGEFHSCVVPDVKPGNHEEARLTLDQRKELFMSDVFHAAYAHGIDGDELVYQLVSMAKLVMEGRI